VKGGSVPLLAWACLQVLLGTMLAIWSGGVPSLLLIGGAMPLVLLAAWNQARPLPAETRLLPGESMPVAVLAIGLAAAAVGLTAGLWLVLVGAEIAAFGAVWLAREMVQERRWLK
jgi:hypothetical protein